MMDKAGQAVGNAASSARDAAGNAAAATRSAFTGSKAEAARRQVRYSGVYIAEIRKRLDFYFHVQIRNVRDAVPQTVGFYLVRSVQDKMQFELLNELNQKEQMAVILGEPPHIMEERRALSEQLKVLQKAINVLTRDPALASLAFEAEMEDEEVPAPRPQAAQAKPKAAPSPQQPAQQQQQQPRQPSPQQAQPVTTPPGRASGSSAAQLFGAPAQPKAAAQGNRGTGLFGEPAAKKNALFD